ncbi:MAG: OmpA family protein [Candidatus Omnitrophica bacterium]|nr:OmpA family protein [Candidatus Omnitrophota bacterium]
MRIKRYLMSGTLVIIALSVFTSGCAVNFYKQSPRSKRKINELQAQVYGLEKQQAEERKRFEEAKRMLESKFRNEIRDQNISLTMDERGLVIILSDDILFDSGKADLKKGAFPVLNNVIAVIKKKVPNKDVGISGHTDNVPIKYSNWKTNWELSTARATNVLYYLEKKGISPARLSATGYGEYRTIASNDTEEGRAMNRRVEIVILPEFPVKKEGIK